MIIGFRDKKTKNFAQGSFVKAFSGFDKQAIRRLSVLNAASCLDDLGALNSNHFEALTGDRNGQYSVRINLQWRLCFEWDQNSNGAFNVEIADYH